MNQRVSTDFREREMNVACTTEEILFALIG